MQLLKYITFLLGLKNVGEVYESEKGNPAPVFLKKRVMGAAITTGSVGVAAYSGYKIDESVVMQFIGLYNGTVGNVYEALPLLKQAWLSLIAMYGVIMMIKGQVDKKLREAKKSSEDKTLQKVADTIVEDVRK
jgi:hypothetical protein